MLLPCEKGTINRKVDAHSPCSPWWLTRIWSRTTLNAKHYHQLRILHVFGFVFFCFCFCFCFCFFGFFCDDTFIVIKHFLSLDTLIVRTNDERVKVKIFRKPTHTDQYLSFESHHPLEHKLNVVRTLFHRSELVTDPHDTRQGGGDNARQVSFPKLRI